MTDQPYPGSWQPAPPTGPTPWLPPAPMQHYQPIQAPAGLGTASIVLAGLVTGVQVITLLTAWFAGQTYADAARDGVAVEGLLTGYDAMGILLILVLVPSYILSCMWLGSSRTFITQLARGRTHARSAVWVWLGWCIPVVSLWFPFQVVRDIRDASLAGHLPRVSLGVWWTGWLAWLVVLQVGINLIPTSGAITEGAAAALFPVEAVATFVCVIAFVQWLRIVREVTALQEDLVSRATRLG